MIDFLRLSVIDLLETKLVKLEMLKLLKIELVPRLLIDFFKSSAALVREADRLSFDFEFI